MSGTIAHLAIWINVECCIGIVCACLPIMRPLLRSTHHRVMGSRLFRSHSSRNANKGSHRLTDEDDSRFGSNGPALDCRVEGSGTQGKGGGSEGKHWVWLPSLSQVRNDGKVKGNAEEMVPMGHIAVRRDLEWSAVAEPDRTAKRMSRESDKRACKLMGDIGR